MGRTNFVCLGMNTSLGQMPGHSKVGDLRKQQQQWKVSTTSNRSPSSKATCDDEHGYLESCSKHGAKLKVFTCTCRAFVSGIFRAVSTVGASNIRYHSTMHGTLKEGKPWCRLQTQDWHVRERIPLFCVSFKSKKLALQENPRGSSEVTGALMSKTLSGFRSACTTPMQWRYAIPAAISIAQSKIASCT